jgi:uracil-DNA glycosylase
MAHASIIGPARWAAMADSGPTLFDEARPKSLKAIGAAIEACRRCPIGFNGTHAVMGEGPRDAALMIVGEQPGDKEEEQGRPFVGPAGQLLNTYLEDAGIDRQRVYLTNAVKHFKFVQRGKRRLHDKPNAGEIDICRWWVDSERELIEPKLILALGASAARGMLGKTVSVQKLRGTPHMLEDGGELWVTVHPSYLLRLQDEGKLLEQKRFAADLRKVAARLAEV